MYDQANEEYYKEVFQLFIVVLTIFAFLLSTGNFLILKETPNLVNMTYAKNGQYMNYTLEQKQQMVSFNFNKITIPPCLLIILTFLIFLVSKKFLSSIRNKCFLIATKIALFTFLFSYCIFYMPILLDWSFLFSLNWISNLFFVVSSIVLIVIYVIMLLVWFFRKIN